MLKRSLDSTLEAQEIVHEYNLKIKLNEISESEFIQKMMSLNPILREEVARLFGKKDE